MAVPVGEAPVLERARDAGARESWAEAYALLCEADLHPSAALDPGDLDVLADAAWWTGHVDGSIAARLRAQAGYAAAGDHRGAGRAAWWLSFEYRRLGRPAAAAGWLHRARHHLEHVPDSPEQCYLAWSDAEEAREHHDLGAALAAALRMDLVARRSGDPDLIALSRQARAAVLLASGHRSRALGLLDDVMGPVTAGELSAMTTGRLYSLVLTRCREAADLGRAAAWTDAAMSWCETPWSGRRRDAAAGRNGPLTTPAPTGPAAGGPAAAPDGARAGGGHPAGRDAGGEGLRTGFPAGAWHGAGNPFRGLCRIHRVEVLDLLGMWTLAEAEAARVCAEVLPDGLEAAAAAHYAAGEIRRRQGRLDEAVRSYSHAHALGRVPQPGLALLRLAQGRTDAAVAGLRPALLRRGDPPHDSLGRAGLLAARTEVALAVGDEDGAARAVTELEGLAGDAPFLEAVAGTARGALALARHEPARRPLRRALAGWRELRVPYEAARVRLLLAAAERAAGDEDAARRALRAARTAFEELGALPDAARATTALSQAGRPGAAA
ncbi:LuxR family transcriptional regulator [Streptomyces sp. NPDC053755]|uniref:LuxR family transcriptional regulator n=1 Tax=Streptomyces sp. NPDC053755 TaxID=3155815 RepID=UPI0034410EF4